ncbi:MAG: cysteine desulfurase [Deltaproteobacteria bacterium]|nr:cysteine desulfurase [Deltaproteobacteria bacterium]
MSISIANTEVKAATPPMPFDIRAIRRDFPILQTTVRGKPLVYLDNAATSQTPQCVIDALTHYYAQSNANIHRGLHYLAEQATLAYEETRKRVATFIGARSSREVIFTRNATEALNLVAQSYGRATLQPGDEILLTEMEHHSNLIPWQLIAKERGAVLRFIPVVATGALDLSRIDTLIGPRTKIVAFTMLSNVMGTITPVRELIQRAHAVGAVAVIDAAQGAAHRPLSVAEFDCDFLAFSAHKMCGPTGVGILYGKAEHLEQMPPFLGGGEMIHTVELTHSTWAEIPHKFEAGTPNIADVIAFRVALDYLATIGMDKIWAHEEQLTRYAAQRLAAMKKVTIYGPGLEDLRDAVIAFNVKGIHPHDVSQALDFEGVAIRAGHHCCQPLMRRLGVAATNRASIAFYNTFEEIDLFISALERTQQFFGVAS